MKRKVMKVAESSALISLPYRWVQKNNIQKGDDLEVEESGNSLIINTNAMRTNWETEVDVTNLDRTSIMYVIRSVYRQGYDKVKLNFSNPNTVYRRDGNKVSVINVIHKEVNRLIGFEVLQEQSNSCLIQDLQEASSKDFGQVLRRVFLILIDTMEEFVRAASEHDREVLASIENRHDTITKFASLCLRLLSKEGGQVGKSSNYYHIIASMDRITDIYKYSARDILAYESSFSEGSIELLNMVKDGFKGFYRLFYKYSNETLQEINDIRYHAEKKLKELNVDKLELLTVSKHFTILEILLDLIEARTALEY